MLLRTKLSLAAIVLAFGWSLSSCSSDEKPVENPVTPAANTEPAAPPTDAANSANFKADTVYFAFDDYTLSSGAMGQLNKLADYLKASNKAVVQVEGHCDERGSTEYNLALGERRAQSVKNYLVQLGVDPARVTTISYGEEKPAVEGHNEEAWAKNRRAEFVMSNQ